MCGFCPVHLEGCGLDNSNLTQCSLGLHWAIVANFLSLPVHYWVSRLPGAGKELSCVIEDMRHLGVWGAWNVHASSLCDHRDSKICRHLSAQNVLHQIATA